jgi:hypothetical protein
MFKTFSTLTILGSLAISAAQAQSNQLLQAEIPFAFAVQSATLPAGAYLLSYSSISHILTVTGAKCAAFMLMIPASSPVASQTGKVVFQCFGDRCYLAAVRPMAASGQPALQTMKTERSWGFSFVTRAVSLTGPAK